MPYSIMLDAGHGGGDPGATFQGRNEKDDTLRLALAVGNILENNGVNVMYTRTTDVYQTPFEKAQTANEAGVDYFVSLHRNSSPQPNQYSGVESLIYDRSGVKLQLAENINRALNEVGFADLGVKERPGLVVLRRTSMPSVLVEIGFINSAADNTLFDSQFDAIAQAIANGIMGTLGGQETTDQVQQSANMHVEIDTDIDMEPEQDDDSDQVLYRVQVGAFRMRQYADNQLYELMDRGYPAFILSEDGLFKVQVGAFRRMSNAVRMEQRLRAGGYSTMITT